MDELHPSTNDDTHYIFLLWVKPEDHAAVVKEIVDFVEEETADWTTTIHEEGFGEGLIVISTRL